MQAYWEMFQSMDTWMQVFWGCAVIGSIIFIVQMVLTLVGMDSSDMDVDFDGADTMDLGGGISLFSIKNFVNFIVGFRKQMVAHPRGRAGGRGIRAHVLLHQETDQETGT